MGICIIITLDESSDVHTAASTLMSGIVAINPEESEIISRWPENLTKHLDVLLPSLSRVLRIAVKADLDGRDE